MASLLATQLNRLSVPEGQQASVDLRRRKSLIYQEIELNKIDTAAHLERAQKAFKHLVNVDSSLEQFFDCFFSEERVHFEPSMQTPEQKATLDQFVEHFLIRISQHLLLGVTLEALEWLVYKFQIHVYNMDAVLQAVFPYHSTNLFPKFLQLFEFNALNKRWHWLKPLANQGLPLVKSELVRVAVRDESVLNFVCNLVVRALKVFGPEEARLSLFVNLYSQVTFGVLMTPADGRFLTKCVNSLNFYILKGLRSSLKCYRHSAYQIIQLLTAKHQLNSSVLAIWMKRLLKSSCKYEPSEVCLLIGALCKTQRCIVPQELLEKFESVCEQCDSTVLNDFPEIVGRSTADVDMTIEPPVEQEQEEQHQQQDAAQQKQLKEQRRQRAAEQQEQLDKSVDELLLADHSPLATVASLLTLLTSRSDSVRHSALACLSALAEKSTEQTAPGEEDSMIWQTVATVLASSHSIQRDRLAALKPSVASACTQLLWRSLRDLLPRQPITSLQRRCIAAHLMFFSEASLTSCLADRSDVQLLAKLMNYPDASTAKAAAIKVSAVVFNSLPRDLKILYLMEGIGSSELTEDPNVLSNSAAYLIEKEVYMDCLADLFCLVPSNASIKDLSNRRKSCSFGNIYHEMGAKSRRQARFLFRVLRTSHTKQFEDGLQLLIKLLDVLQILVQAYKQQQQGDTALIRDIVLCLLCAEKVAAGSEADSGLADLLPAQTVLHCVRSVQDRQCQYVGIGLLCRLCQLAPACVSRCFSELVEFLIDSKFFSREDSHTEQLWRALLERAVPPCSDGVALLHQLLAAYPDVPPSRRADLYRDVVSALGPEDHLWALVLLLNLRQAANHGAPGTPPSAKRRRLMDKADHQEALPNFDQLGSTVLATFPVPLQLLSCAKMLDCLLGALGHREVASDLQLGHHLPSDQPALAKLLDGALGLVTSHLSRRDLVQGMNTASSASMTLLLRSLVDCLLWAADGRRALAAAAVRAIERAEAIVPGAQFLQVITGLLANRDAGVQRKALDLLLGKLTGLEKGSVLQLREALVACLGSLKGHLGSSQVAVICGKELARLLGQHESRLILQLCRDANARCLQLADQQVNWEMFGCCLLLNAEAVKQAGVAMLPAVVHALPALLICLRERQPPPVAVLAAYTYIQQCVLSLCDLLVPYLPQLIPVTANYLQGNSGQQLQSKLLSVLRRIGRCVEFGQLAPVLLQLLRSGGQHWQQYARLLLTSVRSVSSNSKESKQADSLEEFESELTEIFTSLLASAQHQAPIASQLAACLLHLPSSLQLSLVQALIDWSGQQLGRQLALYRLLEAALTSSSSLAGQLVELDIGPQIGQLLDSLGGKMDEASADQLARCLLNCLGQLFDHGALDIDQLDQLSRSAVAQLDCAPHLPTYGDRIQRCLLPCLLQFASAAGGDETLLKPVVRQLCDRCQPECQHQPVRYWSLRGLQALADSLGDVFVDSLATDCVPTLAECAEDDDQQVESLAQELLKEIERKAGEPMEF